MKSQGINGQFSLCSHLKFHLAWDKHFAFFCSAYNSISFTDLDLDKAAAPKESQIDHVFADGDSIDKESQDSVDSHGIQAKEPGQNGKSFYLKLYSQ